MQVAVIGGGIVGVCNAYFLAQAGHDVVVIERRSNVAEGASFGSSGILAPSHTLPRAAPGHKRNLLSMLLKPDPAFRVARRLDPALWRWLRHWRSECEIGRYQVNRERMARVATYSAAVMQDLGNRFGFDYERTTGYLQLCRSARELRQATALQAFLTENDTPHRLLDRDETLAVEPALDPHAALAGALYLPQDGSGNCALFCKQLRTAAQALGVTFHFGSEVSAIEPGAGNSPLYLRMDEQRFAVDAAIVAAGIGSSALLAPLGIRLPFHPVRTYAATVSIRNFEDAPSGAMNDLATQVSITRIGTRMRLAGLADMGPHTAQAHPAAIQTLLKVGQDWFPNAANYNTATLWHAELPTLPDGAPILGATPVRNLYLNIGHAAHGWAMAAGAGRAMADLVSGRMPEIDLDGLTHSRYG
ncbi:MAG: FAD-dependent oxidoreductase [Herminiimonas sp.]|nr:FAD-dependent oxidoreductase [Herminiimonas sp.]